MEKVYYGSVPSDGTKIHYARTSQEFPPLVMLHGLMDNGSSFNRLAYSLYTMYDIFLPDARGHGLSDAPGNGYDLSAFANDVRNLVDALAIMNPIVLGHSMGAATAAKFAAENPDLLRALILIDPPWIDLPAVLADNIPFEELYAQKEMEFHERLRFYQTMDFPALFAYAKKEHPAWHDDDLTAWCKAKLQVKDEAFAVVPSLTADWEAIAEKISCDVLLLTADPEKGGLVSVATAVALQKRHPNWTVIQIPEVGHNIHRDAFAQTKEQILAFLRKIG